MMDREMANTKKLQMKIGGMSCSFCVETIKRAYRKQNGVKDVHVSMSHEEALVRYNPKAVSRGTLEKILTNLGYTIRDPRRVKAYEEQQAELTMAKKRLITTVIFTFISFAFMLTMWSGIRPYWFRWPMLLLAVSTMFGPGWDIKKKAWYALRRGILNQHNLLEFGAFAALTGGIIGFFISTYPISDFLAVTVFVTSYHILSEWVSLLVRTRASQAVQKLLDLQPKTATTIDNGKEVIKDVEELCIDEVVRVRPGERVPIDGTIVYGNTTIDESIVTGESIPVEKSLGNDVVGGSINQFGSIDIRVTRTGEDTFLQQIIKHVEEARGLKPSILIIVDRVIQYFVPGVLIASALAFVFWTVGSFLLFDAWNVHRAFFAMLAVLVMGYPCALGMAMPLALIRGGGKAAEKGILMRSGEAFQVYPQISKIVLDKTGTITRGTPEIVDFVNYRLNKAEVLSLIATAEMLSEHPLAKAIIRYVDGKNVQYQQPEAFQVYSGKGVKASIGDKRVIVGKPSFLVEEGVKFNHDQSGTIQKLSEKGETVIGIEVGNELLGIVGIADTIKEDAADTIRRIRRYGIVPIMITGDNQKTATSIAKQIGIREFYAEVLPELKAEKIRDLQKQGDKIAMVGDGINDAPALMQSDVGIAIGTGTDIAIESSDIIITGQSLGSVIDSYEIAKESYTKTKQNLLLAFLFNGIGVPAAATGLVNPVWAMVAMAASVSTVLLNSFGIHILSRRKEKRVGNKRVYQAYIPGISCEGCSQTILTALQLTDGVDSPQVDVESKIVEFQYIPRTCDINKIEKLLKQGYGGVYRIKNA